MFLQLTSDLEYAEIWCDENKVVVQDIQIFSQRWGSTACGFGGIAGRMLITAFTIVVVAECRAHYVFINRRFAYCVKRPNDAFLKRVRDHWMPGKATFIASKYEYAR